MTTMANDTMNAQVTGKDGFIAALDQSGGSTPGALRLYGIPDSAYSGDAEMFKLVHDMRVRIMTAPAFTGTKVIAAILFEATMDGQAQGKPVPAFLWEDRGVVPFLKIDKGLEPESDGVSRMKPMPALDTLLTRAVGLGIFGTKMRSVVNLASKAGIAAVVQQQFDVAAQVAAHGLMPIIEPEVSIKSPAKAEAEAILLALSERGVLASAGAACSSGVTRRSRCRSPAPTPPRPPCSQRVAPRARPGGSPTRAQRGNARLFRAFPRNCGSGKVGKAAAALGSRGGG